MDIPLASRQLAVVGLWSLGFASVWWGVAQLIFGPGPGWVDAVAAALGLAFPIGTLANAANVSMTLQGHWERLPGRPGVTAGVVGSFLAVVVAAMASLASFRAVGSVTALDRLLGGDRICRHPRRGAAPRRRGELRRIAPDRGASAALDPPGPLLCPAHGDRCRRFPGDDGAAGIVSGYSWVAGSNSAAYVDVGEGWAAGAGAVEPLMLIAFVFAVIAFVGQLAYAATVFGTITVGRPVPQEVLVYGPEGHQGVWTVVVGDNPNE